MYSDNSSTDKASKLAPNSILLLGLINVSSSIIFPNKYIYFIFYIKFIIKLSNVLKVLNKYRDWKALVIGDEPRENIIFKHKNLKNLGFQHHNNVLKILKKASISVACSRWEEPFGRTSLEAASRGCAVIISDKGGLKETITDGIIVRKNISENIFKSIEGLIKDRKKLINLQHRSYKNFYLTSNSGAHWEVIMPIGK